LFQIPLDGKTITSIKLSETVEVESADYSRKDQLLYIVDSKKSKMWSVKMDGKNLTEIKQLGKNSLFYVMILLIDL